MGSFCAPWTGVVCLESQTQMIYDPLISGSFQVCNFTLLTMYNVQYWNPRDAQWRGTGSNNLPDITTATRRMKAMAEQCGYCCRFRVIETVAA